MIAFNLSYWPGIAFLTEWLYNFPSWHKSLDCPAKPPLILKKKIGGAEILVKKRKLILFSHSWRFMIIIDTLTFSDFIVGSLLYHCEPSLYKVTSCLWGPWVLSLLFAFSVEPIGSSLCTIPICPNFIYHSLNNTSSPRTRFKF